MGKINRSSQWQFCYFTEIIAALYEGLLWARHGHPHSNSARDTYPREQQEWFKNADRVVLFHRHLVRGYCMQSTFGSFGFKLDFSRGCWNPGVASPYAHAHLLPERCFYKLKGSILRIQSCQPRSKVSSRSAPSFHRWESRGPTRLC